MSSAVCSCNTGFIAFVVVGLPSGDLIIAIHSNVQQSFFSWSVDDYHYKSYVGGHIARLTLLRLDYVTISSIDL